MVRVTGGRETPRTGTWVSSASCRPAGIRRGCNSSDVKVVKNNRWTMMSTGKLTVMVLTDKVSRGTALGHSIRGPILQ